MRAILVWAGLSAVFSGSGEAVGQTVTWTGLGADGNWSTTGNWSAAPPATGGTLVFSGVTRTTGTNNAAVSSAVGLSFLNNGWTNGNGVFTLAGDAIGLTGEASVSTAMVTTGTLTDVIGLNLGLDSTTGTNRFDIVSGRALTLSGNLTGSGELVKTGLGTLRLAGANTATGPSQLLSGIVTLDYIASNTSKFADGAPLTLGSVSLTQFGGSHTEVVASTTVTGGAMIGRAAEGSATMQLGALSRSAGGALGLIGRANMASTTTGAVNGILPAWVAITTGGADYNWAITGAGGAITNLATASYTTLPTSGLSATTNYSVAANTTLAASGTVYSLKTNTGLTTLALGGNTLTIGSGGLLSSAANPTISGGFLTAGSGLNYELIHHNYGGNTTTLPTTISGTIVDNGSNSVSFTKAGPNVTLLSGSNTYTGPTRIVQGILRVDALANAGAASTLGASTSDAGNLVINGGTLRLGTATTAQSTDRLLSVGVGGATLDSSAGTGGAMVFANTGAVGLTGVGPRTLTFLGSTTGTFAPTIGDGTGGVTAVVKSGANTWTLTGSSSYTGPTTVTAGTLALAGANGALGGTAVTVVGSTLLFDNATTNSNDRFAGSVILQPVGAVSLTGNSAANTTEAFPSLVLDSGAPTITVTQANAGRVATLSPDALSRTNGATALIRGTNLGTGTSTGYGQILVGGSAGTGLSFVGATTMANGSNALSTTVRIVPYLLGDFTANGSGTQLVTYDTTLGLRPLAGGQYATLAASYTTPATRENVALNNNTTLGAASVAVNSLRITAALDGTSTALTVESGAILSPNSAASLGSGFSSVTLGNGTWNEGVLNVLANTFTVSTPIAVTGGGGLTKSGAGTLLLNADNTYTGDTVVNQGSLTLGASGRLAGGTYSGAISVLQGATLTLSNTASQTLNGPVSAAGTGIIALSNTGALVFNGPVTSVAAMTVTGSGSQTFNAPLSVNGLLTLNNPTSVAINGGLIMNAGLTIGPNAGSVAITGDWTNNNSGSITINPGKTLSFGNGSYTSPTGLATNGSTITGGGTFVINSGTLSSLGLTGGAWTLDAANTRIVQNGGLVTGTAGQGLWISRNSTGNAYTITSGTLDLAANSNVTGGVTGIILGYFQSTANTSGTFTVNGDNALARLRQTNGNGGFIQYSHSGGTNSLWTLTAVANVARGELQFAGMSVGSSTYASADFQFNLGGPSGTATVRPFSTSLLLDRTVITHRLLGSNGVLNSTDGSGNPSVITLSVPFGESGGSQGLAFAGTGTTTITTAQTYTGTSWLRGGTLRISATNALQNTPLHIAAGATFVTGTSGTSSYNLVALSGSGAVSLGVNTLTVGSNNSDTAYAGVISGSSNAAFVKVGSGALMLTGSSTLTGRVIAGEGVLSVATIGGTATANPLGQGVVGLGFGTATGTLRYTGPGETSSRTITLAGTTGGGGIEAAGSGALVLGNITATGSGSKTFFLTGTSQAMNSVGVIQDNSPTNVTSLTKDGSGLWRLTAASTYTGTTQILDGTISLAVNADGNVAGGFGQSSSPVLLGNSAAGASGTAALLLEQEVEVLRAIDVAGSAGSQVAALGGSHVAGVSRFGTDTPVRLSSDRSIALLAASSGTNRGLVKFNNLWQDAGGGTNVTNNFTVGGAGFGGIVEIASNLATAGSVSVLNGRLAVGGDTETGLGSLSAGAGVVINGAGAELKFNSATPLTSAVTLTEGILSGTGTINAAVTPGGVAAILSPGNSPGIMTFGTSQTWNSFTYQWETNNFTGTTAGTDFDRITIAGGLSLTGTTAGAYVLDITSLTALNEIGLVPNFDEQARSWTILTTTGGITGFDANRWTLTTSNFSTSPAWQTNGSFSIATANGGNDLVLNFVVVPEPASAAIAGIGIVVAAWVGYRRRR